MAVTGSPPESQHRILFLGFERLAAEQAGVFVGLEVGEPHNHRLGIECRGNRADAFRQPLDEEIRRAFVTSNQASDHGPGLGRGDLLRLEQRHRMHPDMLADDELHAREADSRLRLHGDPECHFGGTDIHHDGGARLPEIAHRRSRHVESNRPLIDVPNIAFGT